MINGGNDRRLGATAMTREPRNARSIVDETLEIDPAVRKTYLDQACAGEPELRQQVEALLATAADADGSRCPETTAPDLAATNPVKTQPGSDQVGGVIGPYRLVGQIGEGGMGTVFPPSRRTRSSAPWP